MRNRLVVALSIYFLIDSCCYLTTHLPRLDFTLKPEYVAQFWTALPLLLAPTSTVNLASGEFRREPAEWDLEKTWREIDRLALAVHVPRDRAMVTIDHVVNEFIVAELEPRQQPIRNAVQSDNAKPNFSTKRFVAPYYLAKGLAA